MAAKFISFACIGKESGDFSPRPRYPSMPKYPKGVSVSSDEEKSMQGSEAKALFSVVGMTCSACAGSVEKAVKRLPGIKEAAVDVLNNRAQVMFYPAFVNVSKKMRCFCCFVLKNEINLRGSSLKQFFMFYRRSKLANI